MNDGMVCDAHGSMLFVLQEVLSEGFGGKPDVMHHVGSCYTKLATNIHQCVDG